MPAILPLTLGFPFAPVSTHCLVPSWHALGPVLCGSPHARVFFFFLFLFPFFVSWFRCFLWITLNYSPAPSIPPMHGLYLVISHALRLAHNPQSLPCYRSGPFCNRYPTCFVNKKKSLESSASCIIR